MSDLSLEACARGVVIPLLDLRPGRDAAAAWAEAQGRARAGFGGFILFGGELDPVRRGLDRLAEVAPAGRPLVGADLERGLAQQVLGGAELPPAMSLGAAGSEALAREAGAFLGREARAAGVDWVLGPVLDLAYEPRNPIVGTRALGADPEAVARLGAAFVTGLQEAGALACAKHFPGHGATTDDSHAALPVVERDGARLRAEDLLPFRRAIEAGVATVMTAHVAYPTLGGGRGVPATLEPALVEGLLRRELGFEGAVVTDALIMEGVLERGEAEAACRALAAGCDLILYPEDPEGVAAALAAWAADAPEGAARLREAFRRSQALRARADAERPAAPACPGPAVAIAGAALTRLGTARPPLARDGPVALLVLDDDGLPGLGAALIDALIEAGVGLEAAAAAAGAAPEVLERARALAASGRRLVALVGCRVRAWKGRPGLAPELAELLGGLPPERLTVVGLCGPAPLVDVAPGDAELLVAWGDEAACQEAAAAALLGGPAPGRLP